MVGGPTEVELPEENEGWRLLATQPVAQERGHGQTGCLLLESSEEHPGRGRKKPRAPLDALKGCIKLG